MAIINKIRERSGWAIGAIAVGLLIFMVLGDLLGPNSRLLGGNKMVVGEIAGKEISIQEFDQELEQVKRNYIAQTGNQPSENEMVSLRDQAWSQLIFKIAFQEEFDRLGITVSEEELVDMVQGNNIHPAIKQAFTDPQTGEFNRSRVVEYLQNLDKMQPEQREMWYAFENNLGPDRVRIKYNNLLRNSVYITNQEAKNYYEGQNSRASLKYLFVPFFSIPDSTISVTDNQLKDYLNRNKEQYKLEEGRSIEYVTIPVQPSREDSAYAMEEITSLTQQFATTENDSLFVRANSDTPYNPAYLNAGELPEALRAQNLQKGNVYGPYASNGTYSIYKVTDIKDGGVAAARASHILIQPEGDTPEAKAAAQAKAKDILNQIKNGADFAQMAAQYGTDGTASQGGDLGWFTEGRMVPPFEKAVFGATSAGLLPNLVETDFGYHIVKVTEPKTTRTYQVATITRSISSGDDTRDIAFRKADELSGTSKNKQGFEEQVAKDQTLVKAEAKNISKLDRGINNLSNAREVIRWAFSDKTDVGEVSPVFEVDDQFVVAVLTGKREKGYASVNDVREELTAAVRAELKAEQIKKKLEGLNGSLEDIASKYGSSALVKTADNVSFTAGAITGLGLEPVGTGKLFSLQKAGDRTKPFSGVGGVLIFELTQLDKAQAPADLKMVKAQMEGNRAANVETAIYQAIRENADIEDNRVRFF